MHLTVFRLLLVPVHLYFSILAIVTLFVERQLPTPAYPFAVWFSFIPSEIIILFAIGIFVCAYLLALNVRVLEVQRCIAVLSVVVFLHSASLYSNHLLLYVLINIYTCFFPFGKKLITMQASVLYLFSALNKLSPAWTYRFTETREMSILMRDPIASLWDSILHTPLVRAVHYGTIFVLLILAAGIFFTHRFRVIAVIALAFHGGLILVFQDVYLIAFFWIMLCVWWLALEK